jgi:glycosyltransferase involved in cell wall biosynthesis
MTPFFSIIMQSTLADYPGAATNRQAKLLRAVDSVLQQSFENWQLIIVADECQQTMDTVAGFTQDSRIITKLEQRPGTGKWFSHCRNTGLSLATGRYRLYLDNDDIYTPHYLKYLKEEIEKDFKDWYFADHFQQNKNCTRWNYKMVELRPNSAGTANIIHSDRLRSRWQGACHYGNEDWIFIRAIMNESKNYRHINMAGYCICHQRGCYDC